MHHRGRPLGPHETLFELHLFHLQLPTVLRDRRGEFMSSLLSPAVACVFIEDLEEKTVESAQKNPNFWLLYAKVTFVVFNHRHKEMENVLAHLNTRHPKTMEI